MSTWHELDALLVQGVDGSMMNAMAGGETVELWGQRSARPPQLPHVLTLLRARSDVTATRQRSSRDQPGEASLCVGRMGRSGSYTCI